MLNEVQQVNKEEFGRYVVYEFMVSLFGYKS